jgi:sec-independent protein translocase protein TatC
MDHIRELQGRLFYIALVFLAASAAAYPFFTQIAEFITAPLGDQQLVYLTPGGAFGFVIKICMYVGFVVTLPVIIYHLYQFLSPVMPVMRRQRLVTYTIASFVLALAGVAFAYYISLPAALYFLTSVNIANINPMLTIDSYFSFAMAYLIAGALLFQLPLVLMIIDSISPLTPKKLMGYQRHILLGSVIIAALISPTPDVLNQLLLAAPLVIMYQIGIGMIWFQHRKRSKVPAVSVRTIPNALYNDDVIGDMFDDVKQTLMQTTVMAQEIKPVVKPIIAPDKTYQKVRSVDGFMPRSTQVHVPNRAVSQHLRRNSGVQLPRRSLDGIISTSRSLA